MGSLSSRSPDQIFVWYSTDLPSSFTAGTWGASDLSPGGSIYVQNNWELQWFWIPALNSVDPFLLGKDMVYYFAHCSQEIKNLISEDEILQCLIIKKWRTFKVNKNLMAHP